MRKTRLRLTNSSAKILLPRNPEPKGSQLKTSDIDNSSSSIELEAKNSHVKPSNMERAIYNISLPAILLLKALETQDARTPPPSCRQAARDLPDHLHEVEKSELRGGKSCKGSDVAPG